MDRLYNVTIEYLGIKKQDKFPMSTICLGKDGAFLVMDSDGKSVRFVAKDCKVDQIAAHVIIVHGYTDKPRHITAYCIYANVPVRRGTPSPQVAGSAIPDWQRRLPVNNNGNPPLTWEGPNGPCEEKHGTQCQCERCVRPNAAPHLRGEAPAEPRKSGGACSQ